MSNIILNFLKRVAARYGDTPSGFTGDVVKATKEIIKGEHTPYKASIPSQRTYLFEEKNFPVSTHQPVFDPSLPQYDVNFGTDTLYIPKQDSVTLMQNLNNRVVMNQSDELIKFPKGYVTLHFTKHPSEYYYDAGHHSVTPKIKDGKLVLQKDDVYDFAGDPEDYISKYSNSGNESSDWERKAAIKLMDWIGQPYEVHQTVPIKFVEDIPSNKVGSDREMLNNILRAFNKEFKKPIDQLSDKEVSAALTNRHLKGDDLIKEWESKGMLKKEGGSIKIKKKNKGKFTESAKRAGKSVQEHARDVVNDPKATKLQKRRAQFALNSKKFKHYNGGTINYLNLF